MEALAATPFGGASLACRAVDVGKKIKGRKRHIVTDTQGNMLHGANHIANIQDRDGAPPTIEAACDSFPTLELLFADGGYAEDKLKDAMAGITNAPVIEVVNGQIKSKGLL